MTEMDHDLYLTAVRRGLELAHAVIARGAEGDVRGMLDAAGDFLNGVDAVDDEGIALFERALVALGLTAA